jgi:hypothetical protein
MILPERSPTANEQKKWDEILNKFSRVQRKMVVCLLLEQNLGILQGFAAKNSLSMPSLNTEDAEKFKISLAEMARIQRAIHAVERLELGVRFENGDVDIIAPPWYTKEQIESYNLGWIIPVVIGVALIIGLAARIIKVEMDFDDLAKKQKQLIAAADQAICANPQDPRCDEWKQEKQRSGFTKTESTIDQIKKGLSEFGKVVTKGAGIGLMIAIPLLAWSFLKK